MNRLNKPLAFGLPVALCAVVMLLGAAMAVDPAPKHGGAVWSGDMFASLGWTGVFVLAASLVIARSLAEDRGGALAYVGLSGQLLLSSAAATIAFAVASECQNYWDAYHFSALAWTFGLASALSLCAVLLSIRLGSAMGLSLRAPALASVCLALLGWTWTWSSSLQSLISEIARALYLATHG